MNRRTFLSSVLAACAAAVAAPAALAGTVAERVERVRREYRERFRPGTPVYLSGDYERPIGHVVNFRMGDGAMYGYIELLDAGRWWRLS